MVESKTSSVSALPEWLVLVYHEAEPYPRRVPLEEVYTALDLPRRDGTRPFVYLNMVETLDGQAALRGTAYTIGTDVDHYLLRQLRVHADAVVYGAGTLRKDDVVVTTHPALQEQRVRRGQLPNPLAIVASAACEFSDEVFTKKFFTRKDFDKLIVTTPRAATTRLDRLKATGVWIEVVPADAEGRVDISALMQLLIDRKITRLLCEGGPTFAVTMASHNAIDELFLTVAFRIGGDPDEPRIFTAPVTDKPLELISEVHFEDAGQVREVYLRFRFPHPAR